SFGRDAVSLFLEDPQLAKLHYAYLDVQDCDLARFKKMAVKMAVNARFIVFGTRSPGESALCIKQEIAMLGGPHAHDYAVIGTKNFGWNNTAVMQLDPARRYGWRAIVKPMAVRSNRLALQAFGPGTYVDLLAALGVGDDGRVRVFTPDHKLISFDQEHLSRAGAHYLASLIANHPALAAMRRASDH
ncbi:MAG: hypothetical protein RL367_1491, partial [Pseudomonadota bacterium]